MELYYNISRGMHKLGLLPQALACAFYPFLPFGKAYVIPLTQIFASCILVNVKAYGMMHSSNIFFQSVNRFVVGAVVVVLINTILKEVLKELAAFER